MRCCSKCNKLIPYTDKYCNECINKLNDRHKEYDKRVRKNANNKKYNDFYHSYGWERVRQVAIVRDKALCQDCLQKDIITAYHTVHHIESIKSNWHKRLDINNLICLCESCHQKRHRRG